MSSWGEIQKSRAVLGRLFFIIINPPSIPYTIHSILGNGREEIS